MDDTDSVSRSTISKSLLILSQTLKSLHTVTLFRLYVHEFSTVTVHPPPYLSVPNHPLVPSWCSHVRREFTHRSDDEKCVLRSNDGNDTTFHPFVPITESLSYILYKSSVLTHSVTVRYTLRTKLKRSSVE